MYIHMVVNRRKEITVQIHVGLEEKQKSIHLHKGYVLDCKNSNIFKYREIDSSYEADWRRLIDTYIVVNTKSIHLHIGYEADWLRNKNRSIKRYRLT